MGVPAIGHGLESHTLSTEDTEEQGNVAQKPQRSSKEATPSGASLEHTLRNGLRTESYFRVVQEAPSHSHGDSFSPAETQRGFITAASNKPPATLGRTFDPFSALL